MDLHATGDSRLKAWLDAFSVTGASLAFIRNGAIEVAAAGVRNVETQEPVNSQTVFDVASLTKPMVAYAVLQLVDAGELHLDEPLFSRVHGSAMPASALPTFSQRSSCERANRWKPP